MTDPMKSSADDRPISDAEREAYLELWRAAEGSEAPAEEDVALLVSDALTEATPEEMLEAWLAHAL